MTYTIDSGTEAFNAHPEFLIETSGVVGHSLCGGFTYVTKYDDESLPLANNDPLAYDSSSNVFTVSTTNINLIDQEPLKIYSVYVEFTTYPSRNAFASSTIEFIDPCLTPFTFATTSE